MKNKIEIVEVIMQEKIASYIKQNRDMNPKELAKQVENLLEQKEKMYNMSEEKIKEELEKMNK